MAIASMLYQTNYIAMVLTSSPYKVLLWDDRKQKPTHEIFSRYEVLNVLLRRDVLVVVCEYKTYVYEFGNFQVLLCLETHSNPFGAAALSLDGGKCPGGNIHACTFSCAPWILAVPGKSKGSLRIQSGLNDATSCEVSSAHSHGLVAITGNFSGSLVATASEQGTVVKVWTTVDGNLKFSFRRGTSPGVISSMAFKADSTVLAVASGNSTVHIFKLEERSSPEVSADTLASSALKAAVAAAAIPRAAAQFKLMEISVDFRSVGSKVRGPVVTFAKEKLLVLHVNGVLYGGSLSDKGLSILGAVFAARPEFKIGAATETEDQWLVI